MAIYVAGGVSGAHINPAVTLAFAVRRKFPWGKVGPYIVAQVLGAFAGAAMVYLLYHDAIDAYNQAVGTGRADPKGLASFSIFATFPAPYFNGSPVGPLIDQIVGTAFLLMFVVAIIDMRNTAVQANLGPFMIGLAVAAIGMSIGANAGYAINPARDFGPRLFAWLVGWGADGAAGHRGRGLQLVFLGADRRALHRRRDRRADLRLVYRRRPACTHQAAGIHASGPGRRRDTSGDRNEKDGRNIGD
ncbi:MIP family channel proteins [Arthrobacter ginsengisoli]|uniref:MIP family channel proteins n=2 Tax=Arthrobacter ginsengisoli TaxID=1356565 RepID=A0ABU1UF21_9MICC|nr:MIP family channel proteins [Arthrobacter ginsengisoli]